MLCPLVSIQTPPHLGWRRPVLRARDVKKRASRSRPPETRKLAMAHESDPARGSSKVVVPDHQLDLVVAFIKHHRLDQGTILFAAFGGNDEDANKAA